MKDLNTELAEHNKTLDEIRAMRLDVLTRAMRNRGWYRSALLWMARVYARLERWGENIRKDMLDDR